MKIVIIGGSGLIGKKLAAKLSARGHDVLPASPSTGVNTLTGEGLAQALANAHIVVDVANSPSFEEKAVLNFFQTSGKNLLAAEAAAGVKHHVALSVVGSDRARDIPYFLAKLAQENLITASPIPYSIVRATQFMEFVPAIAQSTTVGQTTHVSPALFQPIAADDVAAILADVTLAPPRNDILEIAGPERLPLDNFVRQYFKKIQSPSQVITDPNAGYFGAKLNDQTLTPAANPRLGAIYFKDWLENNAAQR